ncbi:MCE family protein [Nocardioides baekrokdamisoli]|nr:MlaD family protein [Nocardioides baekrokdamisoli]
MRFDARTRKDLIKLIIFIAVTSLCTAALVATIGNITLASFSKYQAIVGDATGVNKGDDVRIDGVKVGSIQDIKILANNTSCYGADNSGTAGSTPPPSKVCAQLTFNLESDQPIDQGTVVTIKYRNLVGQRYLALTNEVGYGDALKAGSTIPISSKQYGVQTNPALDLSVLFDGFKPLFAGLNPADLNQFSMEIIKVFQGEGGSLDSLLTHTASLTQTVAARDKVIDSLIGNLTSVLNTVGNRDQQLNQLITTFRSFVGGLKDDRQAILGSLTNISALSVQTASLLNGISDPFANDVHYLNTWSKNLVGQRAELDQELQIIPWKFNKIGGTATYKAWFNFYLCHFGGRVIIPVVGTVPVNFNTNAARCSLG